VDDPEQFQDASQRIGRIQLKPAEGKIDAVRKLVVVILIQFPHHQKIHNQRIFGFVSVVEVAIAVFVATPIDDRPVNRSHQVVYRQQQKKPEVGHELKIKTGIQNAPQDAKQPEIEEFVKALPLRIASREFRRGGNRFSYKVRVHRFGLPHHRKQIWEEVR